MEFYMILGYAVEVEGDLAVVGVPYIMEKIDAMGDPGSKGQG